MARTWPDTRPVHYGTSAERAAYPADGEAAGALFFDYDIEIPYYWDGSVWIPLVGGGVLPLFMYDDASADVAGYRLLDIDHSVAAESTVTAAGLAAGATLIDEWVTPAGGLGLEFLEDGVYHWHVHAEQSAGGAKDAQVYAEIYRRTAGGVETLLVTTEISALLTGSEEQYDLDVFAAETDLDLTDRIVLKAYAFVSGAGNAPTVVLHMEGDTFSRVEIPVPGASGGVDPGNHTHSKLVASDGSPDPAWSVDATGNLAAAGAYSLDMNAGELILDADADTSITADTDDRIDIKTNNVDRMQIGNSGPNVLEGFGYYLDAVVLHTVYSKYLSTPGLVGFWSMTSVAVDSGNAYDMSGQGRTMSYTGGPVYTTFSDHVTYLALDGAGDYLTRADEAGLDITGGETYYSAPGLFCCAWVRLETTGTLEFIMAKHAAAGQIAYRLYHTAADRVDFDISTDGAAVHAANGTVSPGVGWVFVAGRFVPSTSTDVFIGKAGTLTKDTNAAAVPATIFVSTFALSIGARGAGTGPMTGDVALVTLAAFAVSDAFVESVYQQSRPLFGV